MDPLSKGGPSDDHGKTSHHADEKGFQVETDITSESRSVASYTEKERHLQPNRSKEELPLQSLLISGNLAPERLPISPPGSVRGRQKDNNLLKTNGEHNTSRSRNGRTASGNLRHCKKCGEVLTGQFVRALGGTFHLDCFRCQVGF